MLYLLKVKSNFLIVYNKLKNIFGLYNKIFFFEVDYTIRC